MASRAGDVDADVALAGRGAVHCARIHPNLGFAEQAVAELLDRHTQSRDVDPWQISAFKGADVEGGQMVGNETAQHQVVFPEIGVQLVDPLFALVIGCDERHWPEGVEVTQLVDIDGMVQSAAPFWLAANDVGRLQPSDVERFRGRVQHDAVAAAGLADSRKGLKTVAGHDELAVNLV